MPGLMGGQWKAPGVMQCGPLCYAQGVAFSLLHMEGSEMLLSTLSCLFKNAQGKQIHDISSNRYHFAEYL